MVGTIHHSVRVNEKSPEDHLFTLANECPDCRNISRLKSALVEFGYTGLTRDETFDAYEKAIKNDTENDVIAKLIRSQLIEAGAITE